MERDENLFESREYTVEEIDEFIEYLKNFKLPNKIRTSVTFTMEGYFESETDAEDCAANITGSELEYYWDRTYSSEKIND